MQLGLAVTAGDDIGFLWYIFVLCVNLRTNEKPAFYLTSILFPKFLRSSMKTPHWSIASGLHER